jgi:hypothetical protein
MLDKPDFIGIPQLDLENKLIMPTLKLYDQLSFKLNILYQDIRNTLIDAHTYLAGAAEQFYDHPKETLSAWYDQVAYTSTNLYAQFENDLLPRAETFYQQWQMQATVAVDTAGQYWNAFWENPEQMTLAAVEPVSRYFVSATEQTERYWQLFIENPEQFAIDAFTPVTNYLSSLTDSAEVALISSYYALLELFQVLMAQPVAAFQALYANTLSILLDTYYDVISSLLVMA